jgi:ABC-type sugar transport system ATPase subunit
MQEMKSVISTKSISKSFDNVMVLKDINFDIYPGEVHALIGENGAGKSTLIKVLFGVHQPASGEIYMNGEKVCVSSPIFARACGIAMIHQEPLAFSELSILENIYTGILKGKNKYIIDWKSLESEGQSILESLGVNIDVKHKMIDLSIADQQMVEIASALASNANVIFMDESTASLTLSEVDKLLNIILKLKEQGKSIVYISHRLEEIKKVADRVTILRDGNLVGTYANAEITKEDMIKLMLGRSLNELIEKKQVRIENEFYLEVKDISIPGIFRNVSFDVRKGEIFGIAGLVGAGRTEVARALFGVTPIQTGEIRIAGKQVHLDSTKKAIENGIALVPEDRQGLGLFISNSVAQNTSFAVPKKITGYLGWINRRKENGIASEFVSKLSIKIFSLRQHLSELSGGNQQKVSLAKWIATSPEILILDEPTRGIDVGAKMEVYKIINQLAAENKCVIMISSEMPEILTLSDRVMVMYEGTMTALLSGEKINEVNILSAMHGNRNESAAD